MLKALFGPLGRFAGKLVVLGVGLWPVGLRDSRAAGSTFEGFRVLGG